MDFLYDPADDLLITPLPDLMLGFAVVLLVVLPLAEMYPLPERLTLPDALAALIPVARLDFALPDLLTYPLPDLVLGLLLVPDTLVATYFLVPVPLPVVSVLPASSLFCSFL